MKVVSFTATQQLRDKMLARLEQSKQSITKGETIALVICEIDTERNNTITAVGNVSSIELLGILTRAIHNTVQAMDAKQ
jgi:hypothetical protein